jgi:flagellar biosynthesis regulator FlaF
VAEAVEREKDLTNIDMMQEGEERSQDSVDKICILFYVSRLLFK